MDMEYGKYMLAEKTLEHFCNNNKDIKIEDCCLIMDIAHNIQYIQVDAQIDFQKYQRKVIMEIDK